MGYLNGKADDREQYIEAWTNHIKELRSMLGQANIPVSEWRSVLDPLNDLAVKAANIAFPVPKLNDEQVERLEMALGHDGIYEEVCSVIDYFLEQNPDIAELVPEGGYIQWEIRVLPEIGEDNGNG